jgi:hypothetical protein
MDAGAAQLPHVDEHATEVAADPATTWEAVVRVGEALPSRGFRVATRIPERELGLRGHHPFSRYALIFRLDDLGEGRTRVRAETRAVFPGLHGRVYRGLVIGTRMHVLVTRRLLKAIKRRAERP